MLDKILNSLSADPNLDDRVAIARSVGGYIKRNPNGAGVELTPEYIKELAFPDRKMIQQAKDEEFSRRFVKYVEDKIEKQRVEEIRKNNAIGLSVIYDKTRELRGETDKISERSGEIEQNLSQKHENLKQRLESLRDENKSLLEKQLERIEGVKLDSKQSLADAFEELDRRIMEASTANIASISGFESKLSAEKEAERQAEANKPKPVYEQVLVKETGQIITLEK